MKSEITLTDLHSIQTETTPEDREYIRERYGSLGKGLRTCTEGGALEKAIGMVNKLIEEKNCKL